ncbi:glycoside hydrolase family 15 protein [Roseateles sp.]|uniref:glycoside hydrolase family 15 protein n=1 Tax=Roseateles sp. TaxID=1971397 RepID=UPI002F4253B9
MSYPEIESHGVIGNLRTTALVCTDGTIDFFCFPRFDSPSVFLSLLDDRRGGRFSIGPAAGAGMHTRQMYLPDTNVLLTRYLSAEGLVEVIDYMPVRTNGPQSALVRRVRCIRGSRRFEMRCEPKFDYGRAECKAEVGDDGLLASFTMGASPGPMQLRSTVPLQIDRDDAGAVGVAMDLKAGDEVGFVFECVIERPTDDEDLHDFLEASFTETMAYWQAWSERSSYRGRWREIVLRSALILKLLSSTEHGSIIGAATFGLPEHVGGVRNWDYRYCWIRDAAFTVHALLRLGYTEEADRFIGWAKGRADDDEADAVPQVLYAVDGRRIESEIELDHLSGYRDSRPVRVGNAAATQLQLDVVGELVDAMYLADKHGPAPSIDVWRRLTARIDWLCEHWDQPDDGIWEMRGERRDFLSGRLLSWVALDRALRMSKRFARPAPVLRWVETRDAIASQIIDEFWHTGKQAFVQYRGGDTLDAVVLLMPMVKFIGSSDPRWLSTLDAVGRELSVDGLVARYTTVDGADTANLDGLHGQEGAFTACSFWYVECLARAGRVDEARLHFDKLLTYANHLGLYAEEIGRGSEHLGNFPQALTHLALISAALALDRAIERKGPKP